MASSFEFRPCSDKIVRGRNYFDQKAELRALLFG
jgi:hypothetical protein